jgi:predicted short-subunit dehydrogenase-like oxidoreductase (DUF2520 family)
MVLIGSGNVAQHLITAFSTSEEVALLQVVARNSNAVSHLLPLDKLCSDYEQIKEADVYIIAVSDNAIAEVSSHLPFQNRLVVHTSGSMALETLDAKNRRGVFYPLQTFTKNKDVNFKEIPICLESEHVSDYKKLEQLAKAISTVYQPISSEQRKALHVAAVFVCNFVNHLYQIGATICEENQLSFQLLKPLIIETAKKVQTVAPAAAQTGPAKRNDTLTINNHLAFLTDDTQQELYQLLTKSIIDHGKKL